MSDTIAAIATALSPSAIGILRLSGPDTKAVLDAVFFPLNGRPMSQQTPRTMVLGRVLDGEGRVLDSALCVLFPGPDSYTGEDCAELHCHGSPVVLTEGLKLLLNHGARQAKGGEFTQRAFLNGRMDLMQAEAVVDVIDAETAQAARNAAGQLDGALSRTVQAVYDTLMDVTSRFYAIVDYPDEDIEDLNRTQLLDALGRSEASLAALLDTYSRGQVLKNGVPTVLLGKPNVGKSSLLNALVGYDRAIVTDVAGTTRDTVEESLLLGHVLLRLTDTAGIRETGDAVERLGVERSRKAAQRASLALLLLDGCHNPDGARVLAETLTKAEYEENLVGVMGMLADKDYKAMLSDLAPCFAKVFTVTPACPRALSAEALQKEARFHLDAEAAASVPEALHKALNYCEENNLAGVVVCGSLYLAAEARPLMLKEAEN